MKCEDFDTYQIFITDISHHRHHRRRCTFFKPVPLLAQESLIFCRLTIFGYFVTNLRTFGPFTGLNSVVVPQNWQTSCMQIFCNMYQYIYRCQEHVILLQEKAKLRKSSMVHTFHSSLFQTPRYFRATTKTTEHEESPCISVFCLGKVLNKFNKGGRGVDGLSFKS